MKNSNSNVVTAWHLLYVTYGFLPIIAGIDKFFNFITNWPSYLNGFIPQLLHTTSQLFMRGVGVIEILAGLLVLFRPKIGAYVVTAWLLLVSLELISMSHYDIAIRDIAMAVGSYVLVLLTKELHK